MPRFALPARLSRAIGGNPFIASAGKLVSGTAIAQAITVLALPFITRIYTPEDMAVLAAFVAIHNILIVIACGRLEVAIPLAQDEGDATRLTLLAIIGTMTLALLIGGITWAAGDRISFALGLPELAPYVELLTLSVFAAGLYAATQFHATRQRLFGTIATTRVVQALAGVGAQIGLGLTRAGPIGLILGQIMLTGAGALRLGLIWLRSRSLWHAPISGASLLDTLSRFRRFPLYSTPEAFANRAAAEVPVLLVAAYALGPEAGFLLLAIKTMGAPLSLLGNAAGQVFMSDARTAHRDGELGLATARVLILLGKLAIGPTIFAAIIAPKAFALIFGAEWQRAGEIVAWMVAWSALKCLTSPISSVLHVQMRQRAMLALQLSGVGIRVGGTLIAAIWVPTVIVETFAVTSALFYALCLVVYAHSAKVSLAKIWSALPLICVIVIAWASLGVVVERALAAVA